MRKLGEIRPSKHLFIFQRLYMISRKQTISKLKLLKTTGRRSSLPVVFLGKSILKICNAKNLQENTHAQVEFQ